MQKGQINLKEHQLESLCNKLYTVFVLGNLIDEKDNSNDTYSKFCFLTSLALENLTDIETVVDGKKWTIDENASVEDIKELAKRAKIKGAATLQINPFLPDAYSNNTECNNAN
ncbi:MAG: hypothetical protein O2809_00600 [Proteobacteria bacterium]|nr:hypothetical protein [Pseudomonadota bacterium]